MRAEDPTLPVSVPPGPDNPMGTHALYLGFPLIAIHGTNKPYGIGRRVSSGCIRMFPEDIGKVYDMLPVGSQVTVVDQPIKAAWIGDKFYLEVHPTQSQATLMEREGEVPDYEMSERDLAYIMRKAGPDVEKLDWALIRKVVKQRRGIPVEIAERSDRRSAVMTEPEENLTKVKLAQEEKPALVPQKTEAQAQTSAQAKPQPPEVLGEILEPQSRSISRQ
jgi:L,D-transpeptidase ErfK/SrfK